MALQMMDVDATISFLLPLHQLGYDTISSFHIRLVSSSLQVSPANHMLGMDRVAILDIGAYCNATSHIGGLCC